MEGGAGGHKLEREQTIDSTRLLWTSCAVWTEKSQNIPRLETRMTQNIPRKCAASQ